MKHEIFTVETQGHQRLIIALDYKEDENTSHDLIVEKLLTKLEEQSANFGAEFHCGVKDFRWYEFPEVTDDLLEIALDVLRIKDGNYVIKTFASDLFTTSSSKTIRLHDAYRASNDADELDVGAIFYDYGFCEDQQ